MCCNRFNFGCDENRYNSSCHHSHHNHCHNNCNCNNNLNCGCENPFFNFCGCGSGVFFNTTDTTTLF